MDALAPAYQDDDVTVYAGDCLDVLRELPDASVDAVVTDPPYNFEFMAKPWDRLNEFNDDPAFGYYLSGLIDGEGCFRVQRHERGTHSCTFSLKLRSDDEAVLKRAQRWLGAGTISHDDSGTSPQTRWAVQDKAGCQRLVEALDKYPLRAKKALDYAAWRDAVIEWTNMPRGNRWRGPSDQTRMAALKARIEDVRDYTDPPWSGHGYQDWCRLWAAECWRVLKPGGHLLAFGGTRTYHRLATAVEDAGFEVRDSIDWIYAQGFPKSLNVGDGWGTALKPAHEPIVVARKQIRGTVAVNMAEHGTGALNVDGCRVAWGPDGDASAARKAQGYTDAAKRALGTAVAAESATGFSGEVVGTDSSAGRWPANVLLSHGPDCVARGTQQVATTTHYPATRPAGGLGNDGHVGQDGLPERLPGTEVVEAWDCAPGCPVRELDAQSGVRVSGAPPTRRGVDGVRGTFNPFAGQDAVEQQRGASAGGASRFFPTFRYEAKATPLERPTADGVMHPTVKPVALMQWLVRLVVPRGATVLDPFLGSGTTAEACVIEGMRCVGIEREPTYLPLIRARLRKSITPTLGLDL